MVLYWCLNKLTNPDGGYQPSRRFLKTVQPPTGDKPAVGVYKKTFLNSSGLQTGKKNKQVPGL